MNLKITLLIVSLTILVIRGQEKVTHEELNLKNGSIALNGTFSYTNLNDPVIIWVHGSGNVDRNGNQAGVNINANYIKQFRDEINKKGISFVSFDKRTANPKNKEFLDNVTIDDFAKDVEVFINYFKRKKGFVEVILVGHSQGSLTAMLASKNADKYISIAGPADSFSELVIKQLEKQSKPLAEIAKSHFKELKETGSIKETNPMLFSVFAPQNLSFIKNWMSYKPTEEIKKLEIPTLIINGTKDLQVSQENAEALHKAKKGSKLTIIPNMNHVLKTIILDSDNMNSYYTPKFPISKKLIDSIADFIK